VDSSIDELERAIDGFDPKSVEASQSGGMVD